MIGLIEDVRRVIQPGFKHEGDVIALLGETCDDLSISEYAATVLAQTTDAMIAQGRVPSIDLDKEIAVQQTCLDAAEAGLLYSAHDCSDGGLGVALTESCFASLNTATIGAEVVLNGLLSVNSLLFSESPSRIIISFAQSATEAIKEVASRRECPFTILGEAKGAQLRIAVHGENVVDVAIAELENVWSASLSRRVGADALAVGSR
jgi:phosphoribosylformylglycinamidine synthase